jgi:hypothetical protein
MTIDMVWFCRCRYYIKNFIFNEGKISCFVREETKLIALSAEVPNPSENKRILLADEIQ